MFGKTFSINSILIISVLGLSVFGLLVSTKSVDVSANCVRATTGYTAKNSWGQGIYAYTNVSDYCNNYGATSTWRDGYNSGSWWGWYYQGRNNTWAYSYNNNQNAKSGSAGKYYNALGVPQYQCLNIENTSNTSLNINSNAWTSWC